MLFDQSDLVIQLDISEDGFLSLMDDSGNTKDDVKLPEGDIGDKITKLFTDDGKDTSRPSRYHDVKTTDRDVDVIVLTAMGEELAMDAKEAPKG